MMLYSAITGMADTNAQGDEFFALLIEGSVLESIGFELLKLAKGADTTEEHLGIILFSSPPDVTDILEHSGLRLL